MPRALEELKVKRVTLAREKGEPSLLGHGAYGRVFAGRLHFEDASGNARVKRVAVKVFHEHRKLDAQAASNYNKVASDLIAAGEHLPRTRVLRLPEAGAESFEGIAKPGEWIQVSELYGATGKGSKFAEPSKVSRRGTAYISTAEVRSLFSTSETRKAAVRTLVRLASRGYSPALDAVKPLKGSGRVLPMDLDLLAEDFPRLKRDSRETRDYFNARDLAFAVNMLAYKGSERERLRSVALKEASPAFREALRNAFQKAK